jgi:methylglyoxal synthase
MGILGSDLTHDGEVRHAVVGTIGGDGRVGHNIADGAVTVLVW